MKQFKMLMFGFGIFCAALALSEMVDVGRCILKQRMATGVVVGFDEQMYKHTYQSKWGRIGVMTTHTRLPRIVFLDDASKEFELSHIDPFKMYALKDQISILYDADDPHRSYERSFFAFWTYPIILSVLGMGL